MINLKQNPKFLIIRLDRIGDMVLMTPMIKAIRNHRPGCHITLLIQPKTYGVVKNNRDINEIIVYDKYGAQKSWRQTLLLALKLRKVRFDIALIPFANTRAYILSFLAKIPFRIGFKEKQHFLLTHGLEKIQENVHKIDQNFEFIKLLGIHPRDRKMIVRVTDDDISAMKKMLLHHGWDGNAHLIVIHPGASSPQRVWDEANYVDFVERMRERYRNISIVLIGGPGWSKRCKDINSRLQNICMDLSDKSTVLEEAALLKISHLFISNNTGPMHIGSAVGVPMVALFGFNHANEGPKVWGPLDKNSVTLFKTPEKDGISRINDITVEEVVDAAQKIMITVHGDPKV